MSRTMRCVGVAQDKIVWRHFMESKIVQPTRNLQELYLLSCPTRLTIVAWMGGFIGKLIDLTHPQWIFRNITKHHNTNGTIKLDVKQGNHERN